MAVATKGAGMVNRHFGYAREFLVYEASEAGVRLVGHRKTDKYCGGSDTCGDSESRIERIVGALAGCEVVLCAHIGIDPWARLEAAGIRPDTAHALEPIEDAVVAVWHEMLVQGGLLRRCRRRSPRNGAAYRRRCCVNCSACEPLCPSAAIHAATPYFVIDPAACDECLGHYDDPQCASICPIEGAIVDEMNLR